MAIYAIWGIGSPWELPSSLLICTTSLTELNSCNINEPSNAHPSNLPAANWVLTFIMKFQEQLWALGILRMVLVWPLPPVSSEALRVNWATERLRGDEEEWKTPSPSSDCPPDPRQTQQVDSKFLLQIPPQDQVSLLAPILHGLCTFPNALL